MWARASSWLICRALGEALGDRLRAGGGGAHEQWLAVLGDDDVRQRAGLHVEDRLAGERRVLERPEHRQTGELDALGLQMGARQRLHEAVDAVDASGGHEDALLRRAVAHRRLADAAVVDDELVEPDRQQVAGEMADGAVELAPGERRRQLDHAHHEARVGQADPHVVRELVFGEQRP